MRIVGGAWKSRLIAFPSKKDLIRRVMFPMILDSGLTKQWGILQQVIRSHNPTLKQLCSAAMTEELAVVNESVTAPTLMPTSPPR